jgi:hypothetical protein
MMGMKEETIISLLRFESQLGILFIININYIQLLAGIGIPIFQSREYISYIPINWLLHIRQFLIKINAHLEVEGLWLPKKQYENNQFLMPAFSAMKATTAELTVLNNWCIYYKLLFVSEICFSLGQGIQPLYLEYDHSGYTSQASSDLNWQT